MSSLRVVDPRKVDRRLMARVNELTDKLDETSIMDCAESAVYILLWVRD